MFNGLINKLDHTNTTKELEEKNINLKKKKKNLKEKNEKLKSENSRLKIEMVKNKEQETFIK